MQKFGKRWNPNDFQSWTTRERPKERNSVKKDNHSVWVQTWMKSKRKKRLSFRMSFISTITAPDT